MQTLYHPLTKRQLAVVGPESGSFMFVGPAGSGRKLAAQSIARRLNCPGDGEDNCLVCTTIMAGSFADFLLIDGQTVIGIEQIAELQQRLAQRPFSSSTVRLCVIEADAGMTLPAQNRLLKTLEEPPAQTLIILLADHASSLLPTIQSRCRIVHFLPPKPSALTSYLAATLGEVDAKNVLQLHPKSLGDALNLANIPEYQTEHKAAQAYGQQFAAASLFQRLVMAQAIKAKAKTQSIISALANQVASGELEPGLILSLEQAQYQLNANVSPRAVVEALALAL